MLKLKKVAVTGGISSGKSLVCRYLGEFGAHVVDADQIVHHLLIPDSELGQQVIKLIGPQIVVGEKIDRSKIAKIVFLNPRLLKSLENLLHPRVYEEIERQYDAVRKQKEPPPLFVAEIPLLFETGGDKLFDLTVAVVSPQEICWERYRQKTGHEREDFNRRAACQLTPDQKAKQADIAIHNEGTAEDLKKQTRKIFDLLVK
jgi:dephospho-CoA kinase